MYCLLVVIFTLCLLVHIYTDYKEQLLYDKVSAVLMVSGIIYSYSYGELWSSVLGAVACAGIMLSIYWLSNGGMGLGDVKLALVLGVWLGLERGLAFLLMAFISGGVIGVLLLALGIKSRKDAIPFGPYLCLSGWINLFYGQELCAWYWLLWQ